MEDTEEDTFNSTAKELHEYWMYWFPRTIVIHKHSLLHADTKMEITYVPLDDIKQLSDILDRMQECLKNEDVPDSRIINRCIEAARHTFCSRHYDILKGGYYNMLATEDSNGCVCSFMDPDALSMFYGAFIELLKYTDKTIA